MNISRFTARNYKSEKAAWNATRFLSPDAEGSPYVYFCDGCRAWHTGIDNGAEYHQSRSDCFQNEQFG